MEKTDFIAGEPRDTLVRPFYCSGFAGLGQGCIESAERFRLPWPTRWCAR